MGIHTDPETIYRNTFTRMDALLIGAACAFLVRNESLIKQIHRHSTWLCFGPLVTLAALRTQPFRTTAQTEVGLGCTIIALSYAGLLMAVVVTTNNGSILQRVLGSGIMRGFGKYSYAAYIWHILIRQLVLHYELETLPALPPAFVNIPLMIAATLVASVFSYIVVKRPFLALRGHFEPQPAQEPALLGL